MTQEILVYHYDSEARIYLGSSPARMDPLEGTPLVPAHATLIAPPKVEEKGKAAFWTGETWEVNDDPFFEARQLREEKNRQLAENRKVVVFFRRQAGLDCKFMEAGVLGELTNNGKFPLMWRGEKYSADTSPVMAILFDPENLPADVYARNQFGVPLKKYLEGVVVDRAKEDIHTDTLVEAWKRLREKSRELLAATDYTQLPDVPMTDELKEDFRRFRQELRDLPGKTNDPINPEWPKTPKGYETLMAAVR